MVYWKTTVKICRLYQIDLYIYITLVCLQKTVTNHSVMWEINKIKDIQFHHIHLFHLKKVPPDSNAVIIYFSVLFRRKKTVKSTAFTSVILLCNLFKLLKKKAASVFGIYVCMYIRNFLNIHCTDLNVTFLYSNSNIQGRF